MLPEIPQLIKNSDSICKQVVQNTDWMTYKEANKEQIIRSSLSLTYDVNHSEFVWIAVLFTTATDKAICYYNALNGDQIECEISTSAVDETQTSNFTLTPNPVNERLIVNNFSNNFDDVDIEIINNLGITVINKSIKQNANTSFDINTGGLQAGVYYCKLKSGNKIEIKSFVVVR